MICKKCGTTIPHGAAYCPECGDPVLSADLNAEQGGGPAGALAATLPYNRDLLGPIEQSTFFNFAKAFINGIEKSGFFKKPLRWLYILFAVLNILVPVYLLFMMINNNMLNGMGLGGFLIWGVIAFAGWIGFQLWWNRKDKIDLYYQNGDDFFAIPLFSHYIQTTGEWFGIIIAIIGSGSSLIAWMFSSGSGSGFRRFGFPLPMQEFGIAGIIISPIVGFTIILVTKVLAELYRALAAIANNTRRMAAKS